MSAKPSASAPNIPVFIADMPASPTKLRQSKQDLTKAAADSKTAQAAAAAAAATVMSSLKPSTPAPIPSIILQESAEEERRDMSGVASTPLRSSTTLISGDTDNKPAAVVGPLTTNSFAPLSDVSTTVAKQPIYVQVMLQLPGSPLIPVNIPAEVIIPSLTSMVATAATATVSSGNVMTPVVRQQEHVQDLKQNYVQSPLVIQPQSSVMDAHKKVTADVQRQQHCSSPVTPPVKVPRLSTANTAHNLVASFEPRLAVPQISAPETFHRLTNVEGDGESVEDTISQSQASNRNAATRCRQKKRQQVENMEKKAKDLQSQNKQLEDEMTQLKHDIVDLENSLKQHEDCFSSAAHGNLFYTLADSS